MAKSRISGTHSRLTAAAARAQHAEPHRTVRAGPVVHADGRLEARDTSRSSGTRMMLSACTFSPRSNVRPFRRSFWYSPLLSVRSLSHRPSRTVKLEDAVSDSAEPSVRISLASAQSATRPFHVRNTGHEQIELLRSSQRHA